jgi:Fanconi anemia group I protein
VTELIFGISRKLHPEQRHLVGHWAAGLCRKKNVQNPSIAQEVVKLAVHLMTAPDDMILVHDMTTEMKKLASGDEDSVDSSEAFLIVNCKTKNSLATVFLHIAESSLIELEWGLGKLKAMLTLGYGSSMVDEDQPADERTQRLYLEEALYSRSTSVVHVLSSFTHMSLKGRLKKYQKTPLLFCSSMRPDFTFAFLRFSSRTVSETDCEVLQALGSHVKVSDCT